MLDTVRKKISLIAKSKNDYVITVKIIVMDEKYQEKIEVFKVRKNERQGLENLQRIIAVVKIEFVQATKPDLY
jgi:hypothetical protein